MSSGDEDDKVVNGNEDGGKEMKVRIKGGEKVMEKEDEDVKGREKMVR